jgi:hypothetical protein
MANHGSCDSEGKCCRLLAAEGGKNGRVSHVELHEAADGSLTPSTSSCSLSDDASESSISTAPRPRAADQEERPLLEEERIEIGLDEVIEISDDDEIIEISDDDEVLETSDDEEKPTKKCHGCRKRPRSPSPLPVRGQTCHTTCRRLFPSSGSESPAFADSEDEDSDVMMDDPQAGDQEEQSGESDDSQASDTCDRRFESRSPSPDVEPDSFGTYGFMLNGFESRSPSPDV